MIAALSFCFSSIENSERLGLPTRSPSPQPSPAGRGGVDGRWLEKTSAGMAKDALENVRRDVRLPLPAGEGRGEGEAQNVLRSSRI